MRHHNRPYSLLARHYESFVPGVDAMNRHAREKILGRRLPGIRRVLELACGNGATAVDLARKGLEVDALDFSPTFVRKARERAKKAGVKVRVRRGDMRKFAAARPVDLVLCEFAALNNLAERDEIGRVFACAARALVPGGRFLFDVNSPYAFTVQTPDSYWHEGRGFVAVMRGKADPDGLRTKLDFEWFVAEGRGLWRRSRETIWHVAWSDEEIRRALRKAGFGSIRVFDGVDVRPKMDGARRGTDRYFIARKKREVARAVGGLEVRGAAGTSANNWKMNRGASARKR
jgi:SAM-dependent methyltransferase